MIYRACLTTYAFRGRLNLGHMARTSGDLALVPGTPRAVRSGMSEPCRSRSRAQGYVAAQVPGHRHCRKLWAAACDGSRAPQRICVRLSKATSRLKCPSPTSNLTLWSACSEKTCTSFCAGVYRRRFGSRVFGEGDIMSIIGAGWHRRVPGANARNAPPK